MEALQQEVDNLQNERRALKDKLKVAIFGNIVKGSRESMEPDPSRPSSQLTSADTLPLINEINVLRSMNKLLQKNMMELNRQYARILCEKFTCLPSIDRKVIGVSSDLVKKEESDFRNLCKQSNELMGDVFNSFSTYKIENLRNKKSRSSENKQNKISLLMVSRFVFFVFNGFDK